MARQDDVGCKAESRTFLAKNSLEAIFGTITRNSVDFSKAFLRIRVASSIPTRPTKQSPRGDVAHKKRCGSAHFTEALRRRDHSLVTDFCLLRPDSGDILWWPSKWPRSPLALLSSKSRHFLLNQTGEQNLASQST